MAIADLAFNDARALAKEVEGMGGLRDIGDEKDFDVVGTNNRYKVTVRLEQKFGMERVRG